MKFKINDIVTTEFGVGKIVYVNNSELPYYVGNSKLPYLVHIDGFDGHKGDFHGPAVQDNYNNWWFSEEFLELVKRNDNKYEVGDKVKCVFKNSYGLIEGAVYTVTVVDYDNTIKVSGNKYWHSVNSFELVEETSNYITTKDFIKEVEKLGYEVEEVHGTLHIEGSNFVFLHQVNRFKVESVSDNVLDLIVRLAKTPIEFREEPKKYTLELPNTTIKARYFRFGLPHAKHSYKFGALPKPTTNSDIDYQAYFTQEEIDRLPNQELIKTLKKEPVK